jgi:hypothetical protein
MSDTPALEKFVLGHHQDCSIYWQLGKSPCNCGADQAAAELDEIEKRIFNLSDANKCLQDDIAQLHFDLAEAIRVIEPVVNTFLDRQNGSDISYSYAEMSNLSTFLARIGEKK